MKRNLFFYLLIVLAALVLAAMILVLSPVREAETPPVVLSRPPTADAESSPASAEPSSGTEINVDRASVRTAISTLSREEEYSRTLTVQNYWDGGRSISEIEVYVRGGSTRLRITGDTTGLAVKNVLLRDAEAWIWYDDSPEVWHGAAREGDADAYQTLLTYEDIVSLPPEAILDAGYAAFNGENCVYVRYTSGTLGYETLCHISDQTGLLMFTEVYDGDDLIYQMYSTPPRIEAQDPALFLPPAE